MTLPRPQLQLQLATALQRSRIVALLGPRQCGKTTLARTVMAPDHPAYFDLEDPVSAARLGEPMTALAGLQVQAVPLAALAAPAFLAGPPFGPG